VEKRAKVTRLVLEHVERADERSRISATMVSARMGVLSFCDIKGFR
jgi:hypothetical protein